MVGAGIFHVHPPLFYPCRIFPCWHFVSSPSDKRGEPRLGKSMPTVAFLSGCARMVLGRSNSFWGMWGAGVEHWTPTNAWPTQWG